MDIISHRQVERGEKSMRKLKYVYRQVIMWHALNKSCLFCRKFKRRCRVGRPGFFLWGCFVPKIKIKKCVLKRNGGLN